MRSVPRLGRRGRRTRPQHRRWPALPHTSETSPARCDPQRPTRIRDARVSITRGNAQFHRRFRRRPALTRSRSETAGRCRSGQAILRGERKVRRLPHDSRRGRSAGAGPVKPGRFPKVGAHQPVLARSQRNRRAWLRLGHSDPEGRKEAARPGQERERLRPADARAGRLAATAFQARRRQHGTRVEIADACRERNL